MNLLAVVFALLVGVPVVVGEVAGVDVSPADLACLTALPLAFVAPKGGPAARLAIAMALSLAAILFVQIFVDGRGNIRPFFSLLFFFRPYLVFFAGYTLVRTAAEFRSLFRTLVLVYAAVTMIVAGGALASGTAPFAWPHCELKLLGLPLYGHFGINALSVQLVSMLALMYVLVFYREGSTVAPGLLLATPAGLLGYCVLVSHSRQAILGLAAFVGMALADAAGMSSARKLVLSAALLTATLVVAANSEQLSADMEAAWANKLERDARAVETGDWVGYSAGRLAMYRDELEDLARNPLVGTGFRGFWLYHEHDYDDPVGLSPHQQYLGAAWKMGIPAALFYFAFLWHAFTPLYRLARARRSPNVFLGLWRLALVYLAVFCNIQDALTFVGTGSMLMLLLGGAAAVERHQQLALRRPVARPSLVPLAPVSKQRTRAA